MEAVVKLYKERGCESEEWILPRSGQRLKEEYRPVQGGTAVLLYKRYLI
jgi:hypothetical protein